MIGSLLRMKPYMVNITHTKFHAFSKICTIVSQYQSTMRDCKMYTSGIIGNSQGAPTEINKKSEINKNGAFAQERIFVDQLIL